MAEVDVLVGLDACIDILLRGNVVPRFSQIEQLVDGYAVEMGGSGAIFACQCAKLGLRTAAVGRVGADAFGELFVSALRAPGVDVGRVESSAELKTGVTVALCAEEDRAMLTYLGSIDALDAGDFPDALLRRARHLHIASPFLMTRLRFSLPSIARRARALGLTVSLDTNWDPDNRWAGVREILAQCDLYLPNEQELLAVTNCADIGDALRVARDWVPHVALKCGARGARYAGIWGDATCPAYPQAAYVDAVGAGDSFDGGFLSGFLSGAPAEECLQLGCAAGSLNTRAAGGTRGQGTMEELRALIAKSAR